MTNLKIPNLRQKKKVTKVPDYGLAIGDDEELDEFNLQNLFDEGVLPDTQKQIVPRPPSYEESLKDIFEGKKQIYVDPQYFPEEPLDLPPEYNEVEKIDYTLEEEDNVNYALDDIGLPNYDDVEAQLNRQDMTPTLRKNYLNRNIIKKAKLKLQQLKGHKSQISHAYNIGKINEAEKTLEYNRIDDANAVLKQYYYFGNKLKTIKGSGIRKKKQRAGNVVFFNNPKQLLKKLEIIIGELMASNNSIQMRNTGVAILDMLLKMSTINKPQYNILIMQSIFQNWQIIQSYYKMEREIVLSSYNVKDGNNRPGNFITRFDPPLMLDRNHEYVIGLNRIITMSFTWTNINPGYNNQSIKYSKDNGSTFTNIEFSQGVWNYADISRYIGQKTVFKEEGTNKDVYPIALEFDQPTLRVIIRLATNYQLDLTNGNFYDLIGFDKVIKNPVNIGVRMPNLVQNTEILNVHCDLVNESLVDGFQSDIIYSFGTGDLQQSYSFTKESMRITYSPINKNTISSIRIYVTDGKLRSVNFNNADTAFSLIMKRMN